MFLLRAAFWLTILIFLLPTDPGTGEAPRVGAFQALSAVQATAGDVSSFCDRNPEVCATGSAAAEIFSEKIRYGIRLIQNAFDARASEAPGGDTLTAADVATPWRGALRTGGNI